LLLQFLHLSYDFFKVAFLETEAVDDAAMLVDHIEAGRMNDLV
jgi:hypothetical protein